MNLLHCVYEPPGEGPHPTVLALHGWGANALDLLGLAPYVAGGRLRFICPQGPVTVPLGPTVGYGWFPLTAGGATDPQEFAAGLDALHGFLDGAVDRYSLDERKLVCLGFSQGGVMAYALALGEPTRFAGLVALSSWLPGALVNVLPAAERSQLPVLVHHGVSDPMIEVTRGRHSVELLRQLGTPVTYREFDMGHEIDGKSLADLSGWLEQQLLSPILIAR